jgi:hypothetical protein
MSWPVEKQKVGEGMRPRAFLLTAILFAVSVLPAQNPTAAQQPPSDQDLKENLVSFDYRLAELEWRDGRWQLRAGGVWLKDFGGHERDARDALNLIRELHLNQHGTIGTLRPVIEYWLSDGRAPTAATPATRAIAFAPQNLTVQQMLEQWCLCEGRRALFAFGGHEEQARQALAIIQHYGFDAVAYIGRPAPVMMYFLSRQNGLAKENTVPASAREARMRIPNNPFARSPLRTEPLPGSKEPARSDKTALAEANTTSGSRQLLTPGPAGTDAAPGEERVALDWRQAQVKQIGSDWRLLSGSYTISNFGSHENDARLALAVVQHYRFTEHCLIGQPAPTFAYFLSSGQAPHGLCLGAHNTPFRIEDLAVRKAGDEYVLAAGAQILLRFGDKQSNAREALQAIKHYRFNCLCTIGSAEKSSMTFLVRDQ